MKEKRVFSIGLVLALALIAGFQINPAHAGKPAISSIEPRISGNDTIIDVTVWHTLPGQPPGHYVDKVEVDIDGAVQGVNLTPQSTVTFVVQYNMGEMADTPTVQARAHCTWHGWSDWSEPVVIPEFPTIHFLLILTITSITILLFKSRK